MLLETIATSLAMPSASASEIFVEEAADFRVALAKEYVSNIAKERTYLGNI